MRVVSFFAGCGGLDLGFENAGFHVVCANEYEPHCRATYIHNHPNTDFILGDIRKINPISIPDCDGFIGGPPCQSWSVGGKQNGLDDERGQLFLKYIELIDSKKPMFFVIENVKGMLDEKFKDDFEYFINKLDSVGYNVQWSLLDAVNYHVPQNRERVFFIGFKKELNVKYLYPTPNYTQHITLEQAIGDIKEEPRPYQESGEKVSTGINSIGMLPNHDVLTSKFGSFYYRGNRRRGWQQPSFTINATAEFSPLHPASPKMMYYGHENWAFQKEKLNLYRRLSVRECARIQTFPDNFIFEYDDLRTAYRMIGNAVPPRLGKEIAESILNALNGVDLSESRAILPLRNSSIPVLVGYYKNNYQKQLILKNKLYYVRSDGRQGSMFNSDCQTVPHFILIHHKDSAEFYELDAKEPILSDASFLNSLGFQVSGEKYLCFRIKDTSAIALGELRHESFPYAPYFTTLKQIIKEETNNII